MSVNLGFHSACKLWALVLAYLVLFGCSDAKFSSTSTKEKSSNESTPSSENTAEEPTTNSSTPQEADIITKGETTVLNVENGVTKRIDKLPLSLKVGVNHEDETVGADYNDAVLCFNAKVRIEGQKIFSAEKQTNIPVQVSNISACSNWLEVSVLTQEGKVRWTTTHEAGSRRNSTFSIPVMEKYDELRSRINKQNCKNHPPIPGPDQFSSLDPSWTKVLPNVCNTTGS